VKRSLPLLALTILCASCAAPDHPAAGIPPQFSDGTFFLSAIMQQRPDPLRSRVTGITVPHHLLARDLIARTFWLASGSAYDRVIVLSPDHYGKGRTPITVTGADWRTAFGTLNGDTAAAEALLRAPGTATGSFFPQEHGIGAVMPFIRRFFPTARIVAVAIRVDAPRAALDAFLPALEGVASRGRTLVVQSTDFSHYLTPTQARARDQQTLDVLASGDAAALWSLSQPENMDSLGAQYLQMRVQHDVFRSALRVTENRNSASYASEDVTHTTSYVTQVYAPPDPAASSGAVVFGGDVFLGRGLRETVADASARARLRDAVLARTGGAPLIVNLEGVLMPECPGDPGPWTLCMETAPSLALLREMHVIAVGTANNHALDFGSGAYAAMTAALRGAGIRVLERDTVTAFPGFRVAAFTDVENNPAPRGGLLTDRDLDVLPRPDDTLTIAFVHWGTEYRSGMDARQIALDAELRKRGVTLVIGAHPHVPAGLLCAADGCTAPSLGNLLFDQPDSSGALLEVRVFPQGTMMPRLLPGPSGAAGNR
jgi:AmmeMemoRadiSam system protein B